MVMVCLVSTVLEVEGGQTGYQCGVRHQEQALAVQAQYRCEPRPTVVELDIPLGVVEIRPSHITVSRCSGSCSSHNGLSCLPLQTKMVPVEVMTVSSSYSSSAWITLCQTHQVREDLSCSCECPITKHNCTGHQQIFLPHQCRCLCQNRYAHTECL